VNWAHLKTVVWLRWRLSRNQWARGGTFNAFLGMLFLVGGIIAACTSGAGGLLLGWIALGEATPQAMLLVWDGLLGAFLFFWIIGLVTEIQRSESLDVGRLLHLPISLKQLFTINYLASHLTVSVVIAFPAMLGLSAGLITSRGAQFALMIPLALGFVFMVTAWTYCLRGWLVSVMVNKRRRRAIIMGVTAGFVFLAQVPNLYFNVLLHPARTDGSLHQSSQMAEAVLYESPPPGFMAAHHFVPPLWVAHGAMSLAESRVGPALWGAAGLFLIGAVGLRRAYWGTVRFYGGEQTRPMKSPAGVPSTPARAGRNWVACELPWVPGESAPLVLATCRSLSRAPEVKMALITPLIMLAIFASMLFSRSSMPFPEGAGPILAAGAVAFSLFGLVQLLFNQFGFDRDGFRVLVLLPTPRRHILLGKNLAFFPWVLVMGLLFLLILKVFVGMAMMTITAAIFQLITAFLLLSIVGNFASILTPYRIATGSLKPTKTALKTTVLIFLSHMLFPFALLPIFIPPGLEVLGRLLHVPTLFPVNLAFSFLFLIVVIVIYRLSLPSLGALLEKQEQRILQVVTREVE
jgi:ABC-2 type transport system permease protein